MGSQRPHLPCAFPPGSQGGRHQVVQQEHRQEQLHILLPALREDVPEAEPADAARPDTHRCEARWLLEDPSRGLGARLWPGAGLAWTGASAFPRFLCDVGEVVGVWVCGLRETFRLEGAGVRS